MKAGVALSRASAWLAVSALATAPAFGAGWAYQDSDNTVHIDSEMYTATVSNQNGTVDFFDREGNRLTRLDFVVAAKSRTIARSEIVPVIALQSDGDAATVVITQPGDDLAFTSTLTFSRSSGRVSDQQIITYNTPQSVLQEKFQLLDVGPEYVDENGTSNYAYAYIGSSTVIRKDFALPSIPRPAKIRAYAGWLDSVDGTLNSVVMMSVNGHDYNITPVLAGACRSRTGPTAWIDVPIDPSNLVAGLNSVTFRFAPRIGSEYVYLGLDTDHDSGRSAFSNDGGNTWNFDDLASPSGEQNGEYLVRLISHGFTRPDAMFWNGASNLLTSSATVTKYSPRLMMLQNSQSPLQLILYGSDYGAENIENISFASTNCCEAHIYQDIRNGLDSVVDPQTGVILDPSSFAQYQFNDIARAAGEQSQGTLVLEFNNAVTSTVVTKARWPRNHQAAWTESDDADAGSARVKRAVYYGTNDTTSPDYGRKGFVGHNLKTTVTVFWQPDSAGISVPGDHRNMITDLFNRGFEISLHTATNLKDGRDATNAGIAGVSQLYGLTSWIDHAPYNCNPANGSGNFEDTLCWGKVASNSDFYNIDLLQASAIKFVCPASDNMLYGTPKGMFANPRCLPHFTTYLHDPINSRKLFINGRYGRSWDRSVAQPVIDSVLAGHDGLVGYTHCSADGWFDPATYKIYDEVENALAYIESRQNDGSLWVTPMSRMLQWMLDWESVTIASRTRDASGITLTVQNTLDKQVKGLTLVSNAQLSEALMDGLNLIYLDRQSVVLPTLNPLESRTVQVRTGATRPDIPRLIGVDADVDVASATYDLSAEILRMRLEPIGTGLKRNRRIQVQCGTLRGFTAKDGAYQFAVLSPAGSLTADPGYQVSFDVASSTLTLTLPDLSAAHDLLIQPIVAQGTPPDIDGDGDVDDDDSAFYENCSSGSAVQMAVPCSQLDLDGDSDLDADDFGILQRCYSGTGQTMDPTCRE